jgi:alpha-ketoglutaric semialdehyde dehydrogenase
MVAAPNAFVIPAFIPNWIGGHQVAARAEGTFHKLNPSNGRQLCTVARSGAPDVDDAVKAARRAQAGWAATPPVRRGEILHAVASAMEQRIDDLTTVVAAETGKPSGGARGEVQGAVALARFMAGEGQRMYGRTTTSATANKWAMTIRQPLGVAGLIVAANTPIANVAWKVFPALICGNGAVLKAAEDTPATAWLFGSIAQEAGLPPGILSIVQGLGPEAGAPLVDHPDIAVLSFTGSTAVGKRIAVAAGNRMARVSLELGGKNPFVVCDDADLKNAVKWAVQSAFSNAGQRCASGSRLLVFDSVYEQFRDMLVTAAEALKVGSADDDDFGPVINERQLNNILGSIDRAKAEGAVILAGGRRLTGGRHDGGFFIAPTLIEDVSPDAELSVTELFGPVASIYRIKDFSQAVELANKSPYGLTACIHTRSFDRALEFVKRVDSGVVVVNAGTFGSEPHMPFGGVKQSGNGSREPGTEALDIYSNLKDVYFTTDPTLV